MFQNYHLTAEGYRKRFREAKLDREETFTQLAVRLRRYFDRWVELSKKGNLEGIIDLLMREQLLNVVDPLLSIHLKERNPESVDQLVKMADLYKEAHTSHKGKLVSKPGSNGDKFRQNQVKSGRTR